MATEQLSKQEMNIFVDLIAMSSGAKLDKILCFFGLPENPPKLQVSHYNALQKINPELYGQFHYACFLEISSLFF